MIIITIRFGLGFAQERTILQASCDQEQRNRPCNPRAMFLRKL